MRTVKGRDGHVSSRASPVCDRMRYSLPSGQANSNDEKCTSMFEAVKGLGKIDILERVLLLVPKGRQKKPCSVSSSFIIKITDHESRRRAEEHLPCHSDPIKDMKGAEDILLGGPAMSLNSV